MRAAKAHHAQKADLDAIDTAVLEIEKSIENLAKVATWAETIKSSSQKILDRVAKDREVLQAQIEELRDSLQQLGTILGGGDPQ